MNFGAALLAIVLWTAPSSSQTSRVSPANSLPRALAACAAGDNDRDGRISVSEARAIPVSAEVFEAKDENKDGFWSRDEFLVFYRHQLIAGGQRVGEDLEAEVARLQALKRVRAVEDSKKLTAETSVQCADAAAVEERFENALADLEQKCAARKTTREDFQRLRNLVILNGRVSQRSGSKPGSSAAQSAMLATLDRIERRASLGPVAKEEFQVLRGNARVIPRSANAVPPLPSDANRDDRGLDTANPPVARPVRPPARLGPADARQRPQKPQIPSPVPAPSTRPPPKPPEKEKPERSRP